MKGSIWIVAVVGVTLAVGFLAIPAAVENTASSAAVENETHTLTVTSEIQLDGADEWYSMRENETVVDKQNGTVYDRGDDYLIDYENGTLRATQNGTAGGDTVLVNYSYRTLDEQTEGIVGLLSLTEPVMPLLFLFVCVGALFGMAGWW
jgi:hypothetical protein